MTDNNKTNTVLYIIGIVKEFPNAIYNPLRITFCEESIKVVLFSLLIYFMGISIYESTKKNYRRKEEHGSAKWGNAKTLDKKYKQNPISDNKILTQNVKIGLDGKKHRRNLNFLICGGSGAGKTRFYAKPNIMQCNCSFVCLDPKRRTFKRYRKSFREKRV